MSEDTSKGNPDISCNNDESKIKIEKIGLETVPQNLLNCNANFCNTKGINFINLTKKTAINDDKVLQKYKDSSVTGLKYVLLVL